MAIDVIGHSAAGKPVLRKSYDSETTVSSASSTAAVDTDFTDLGLEDENFGFQVWEDLSVADSLSRMARYADETLWTTTKIDYATAAAQTVIGATAGQKIIIRRLWLYNAGDASQTVTLQSGSTELIGPGITLLTLTTLNPAIEGLVCGTNEAFKVTMSAAKQLNGYVTWRKFTAIP